MNFDPHMTFLRIFLLPLAALYGVAVWIRNLFFDLGLLPSKGYAVPVINIGNLSTGGTGKSPHVEYLIELLAGQFNIAVLSRGYGRNTKGFMQVLPTHKAMEVGDEPLMFITKHPHIVVAVSEKRTHGIEEIQKRFPEVNLILLDDAFQHRFVKPSLNILLTEYHRPFMEDWILPLGNLRESKNEASRADVLIVTKTPGIFPIMARKHFLERLQPYEFKQVFFSTIQYGKWIHIRNGASGASDEVNHSTIYLVTGIAHTYILEEYLKRKCTTLIVNKYKDHHQFREEDLQKVRTEFGNLIGTQKVIVMTEKDYVRIKESNLENIIADLPVFIVPIKVVFHKNCSRQFDDFIKSFLKNRVIDVAQPIAADNC